MARNNIYEFQFYLTQFNPGSTIIQVTAATITHARIRLVEMVGQKFHKSFKLIKPKNYVNTTSPTVRKRVYCSAGAMHWRLHH